MTLDIGKLEVQIRDILTAPGTDLSTISAKRVRKQLVERDTSFTADFVKEHKEEIDKVIARVFEDVSAAAAGASGEGAEGEGTELGSKRKRDEDVYMESMNGNDDDGEDEQDEKEVPTKKAKKARKTKTETERDEELARQLSQELNGRARSSRATVKAPRAGKKGGRSKARKSAATIEDEDDADDASASGAPRKRRGGGGLNKEYSLSEPLAAVLQTEKLSRPQVVKRLWEYIKGHNLQNPANKREIMCDDSLRAVFNTDKIDMFKMNKVLGSHLHQPDPQEAGTPASES
ncbi:SWIB-domain-containing protein [Obba rivulosa]|uniref:SWIB-domain-containing protein n=1 Tax=Obba rivulosa TaxID=1052685 RepID=A0A8E2DKB3_9APHY|nr:SWIB-domain-containing protein [Obba rivulosa]